MKDEIHANSLTLICSTDAQINISKVFEFLPISILYSKDGKQIYYICLNLDGKKKRLKLKFYGYNGALISCRYNHYSRGIRVGGNQMQNVVSVDYQFHDKNYNLKISSGKIQLTGALSEQSGVEVMLELASYIVGTQKLIDELSSLDSETKELYKNKILAYLYDKETPEDISENYLKYFTMIHDKCHDQDIKDEYVPTVYDRDVFSTKIDTVMSDLKLYTGNFKIYDVVIANAFYTHRLFTPSGNLQIPLCRLFEKISHLPNIYAKMYNVHSSKIVLKTPSSSNPKKSHLFHIFSTGTINQHSGCFYPEAYRMYYQIVGTIVNALQEIDSDYEVILQS